MTETTNYHLTQWAKSDRIRMEDFNADNAKIDAALATIPQFVLGTYEGDGESSRTIELGFTPRAIFVTGPEGLPYSLYNSFQQWWGGLAFPDYPAAAQPNNVNVVEICEGGIRVHCFSSDGRHYVSNSKNTTYRYIALK